MSDPDEDVYRVLNEQDGLIRIELPAGSAVKITFRDTDGEVIVDFAKTDPDALRVWVDCADDTGRDGIIYEERFTSTEEE